MGAVITPAAVADVPVLTVRNHAETPWAFRLLHDTRFVPFDTWQAPNARIVYWAPLQMARRGIAVPRFGVLTPVLHQELCRQFARTSQPIDGETPVSLLADRYTNGEQGKVICRRGELPHGKMGAGRGGFTSDGLYYLKGARTPFAENGDGHHNSGSTNVRQGMLEVVAPEILSNLLEGNVPLGVGIVALDEVTYVAAEVKLPEPASILVRAGLMTRFAHLVEYDAFRLGIYAMGRQLAYILGSPEEAQRSIEAMGYVYEPRMPDTREGGHIDFDMFLRTAHALGHLRWRSDPDSADTMVPDIDATIPGFCREMAVTCARQFRWGILQGAPSAGNYQIDSMPLDNLTVATNARRAGVTLYYAAGFPFGEQGEFQRLQMLPWMLYESILMNLSPTDQVRYHARGYPSYRDMAAHLITPEYERALEVEFLCAAGLKRSLAERVQQENPELTAAFRRVLYELATYENPGPIARAFTVDYQRAADPETLADKSVVDVFQFLGQYANVFSQREGDLHMAVALLYPKYNGDRDLQEAFVTSRAQELVHLYQRVMATAETIITRQWEATPQVAYYDGTTSAEAIATMHAAVAAKAAYENQPVGLRSWIWRDELNAAVKASEGQGYVDTFRHPTWVTTWVRDHVEPALRNTQALQRRGEVRVVSEYQYEVEVMPRDGVEWGIQANALSGERRLFVRLLIDEATGTAPALTALSGDTAERAELRYCLGDDVRSTAGRLIRDGEWTYVEFAIPVHRSQHGMLEATIGMDEVTHALHPYAFSVPDDVDLRTIVADALKS